MTAYKMLAIRTDGPVDWVTLNRPERLNALNDELIEELSGYFGSLAANYATRIVVLRGAGRAFCAGLDLKDHGVIGAGERPASISNGLRAQHRIAEIMIKMRRCPQPIIALVHGPACGGGFALALASDVRIAGESARMNAAFIRIGLSGCDIGVSYFLPRLVGASLASELLLTGRFLHAERALRHGLVSDVVPDAKLEDAARPLLEEMLTTAPLGLRLTKEALNYNIDASSLEAAIALEDRNQILCGRTEDSKEGVRAFLEKRKPVYRDC